MKNDPLVEILKNEFKKRKTRNGSYSLRSYSRDLDLDPSNLSKMINYGLKIGPSLRLKIGKKLGFENNEFLLLSPAVSNNTKDSDYSNHKLEIFQVISEWQHYIILEYFKLEKASAIPSEIASHLGLDVSTVKVSLQRLVNVGLLKKDENGFFPIDHSSSSILDIATSKAHRDQQQQILEGAIQALSDIPIDLRSQSSMTIAIDSKKIDEAKELIKSFRRELGRLLSSSENLDEVYQLSVSLYPVTQISKNINNKTNKNQRF